MKSLNWYMKTRGMPEDALQCMYEDQEIFYQAQVNINGVDQIDRTVRSSEIKAAIKPEHYPDVCEFLLDTMMKWNPNLKRNDYMVGEFDYLRYKKGDHFAWHEDKIPGTLRQYSTSTIIRASDDLTGGELEILDVDTELSEKISLDVGETVFFSSYTPHRILPVLSGTREVLVAWIWEKNPHPLLKKAGMTY